MGGGHNQGGSCESRPSPVVELMGDAVRSWPLVTPSPIEDLSTVERSHVVKTAVRAAITAALLVAVYFVMPIEHRPHQSVALRLGVALAIFVVVLANEIRLISSHERPM